MKKWKIKFPPEFTRWLMEKELDGVKITRIANEYPDLFRMAIIIIEPSICVLYGLSLDDLVIVGAWGDLKSISDPATIKAAQNSIQKHKESHHG